MKSSAHASATVFQNGGSACSFVTVLGRGPTQKAGFWLLHIPKRGRGIEDVASDARALPTSSVVIVGGGVIDVVVVTVGNSRGVVGIGMYDGIPGSTIFGSVNGPVNSGGRASSHGRDARVG
jgi:hypothetical protein